MIDKNLKGQIKANLMSEDKRKEYGCDLESHRPRKMYISITEAENGWTVSCGGNDYVASDESEALEIVTTLLEVSSKLKKDE